MATKQDQSFLYIAGAIADNPNIYHVSPVIIKVDTSGKTIWTYSLNKEIDDDSREPNDTYISSYTNASVRDIQIDNDYVFIVVTTYTYQDNFQIWCLNKNTGDLVWRKVIPTSLEMVRPAGTKYLAYSCSDYYGYYYVLTDRNSGKELMRKTLSSSAKFEFDKDGAAYLFVADSIMKYGSPLLENNLWNAKADIAYGDIKNISLQDDGKIYFFGDNQNNPFCGQVNKLDGVVGWKRWPGNFVDAIISSYKIKNGHIYISAVHRYYGGAYHAYTITKLEQASGNPIFEKYYNDKGQEAYTLNGPYVAINNVDADDQGNVYASGYENADDSRTGTWSVLKLAANGDWIYHDIVGNSQSSGSGATGQWTMVINNRVIHTGTVNNNGKVQAFFTAADTGNTFKPFISKSLLASYQFPSAIKEIRSYSASKYAVFKQTGNSATLELRNNGDGSMIWSQKMAGGAYTSADKMAITADNKIIITTLTHLPGLVTWDYQRKPDSIHFIKFDSTGTISTSRDYYIGNKEGFQSIQLYASPDSNVALVYSRVSMYGTPLQTHIYNPFNATDKMGGDWEYISSAYFPIPGNQQLLSTISKDTAMLLRSSVPAVGYPSQALYRAYTFNKVNQAGMEESAFHITNEFLTTHNMASCDSNTALVVGIDSDNHYVVKRFNFRTFTATWTNQQPIGTKVDMALTGAKKVYWTGSKNNALVITQLDINTGKKIREQLITAPAGDQYYVPMDQAYNPIRHQYVVCGYLKDTLLGLQQPFYVIVDSSGNILRNWTATSDYRQKNQLNSIAITPTGQTLIGGALYNVANGHAGIMIAADKASPDLDEQPVLFCEADSLSINAGINSTSYQWQQDNGSGYTNIEADNHFTGTSSRILQINNIPASWNGYRYRCLTTDNSSTIFKLTGNMLAKPTVTITAGDTLIMPNNTVTLSALPADATAPVYQWLINGTPAGTNQQILTTPPLDSTTTVQVKMTTSNACTGTIILFSNIITIRIRQDLNPGLSAGVNVHPNPVTNTLVLDSLKLSDQWESLEILDMNGNIKQKRLNIGNQTKLSIPVESLQSGMYIIKLHSSTGNSKSGRFIKM